MLQCMGSQTVGHNVVTKKQQQANSSSLTPLSASVSSTLKPSRASPVALLVKNPPAMRET